MKTRFRMFRRGNDFWSHDGETGKQETLRTKDKATALRLLHSKNEAYQQPILNLQIARTYLTASDPEIAPSDLHNVAIAERAKLFNRYRKTCE